MMENYEKTKFQMIQYMNDKKEKLEKYKKEEDIINMLTENVEKRE